MNSGTFTGLIPGIHINLVSNLLITLSPILIAFASPISLACFIISMAITHSFLDVIPSTYLGAPDADNALLALPAHRMLLNGRAYEAIRLTVIGSYLCLLIGICFSYFLIILLKYCYGFLSKNIFWILIVTVFFIIFKDRRRFNNLVFFLLSGTLGIIALNLPSLKDPLLPMLSGLFGTSILIISFFDKVNLPMQNYDYDVITKKDLFSSLLGGFLAGGLTSFLPGLGASQGAVVAQSFFKKISRNGFLIMIGGINTINFTLSLATYYSIQKARNGGIIAVSSLVEIFSVYNFILFLVVALLVGSVCVFLCLNISKFFSRIIVKVNYQILILCVILIVTFSVFLLSNWIGFVLYLASVSLGLLSSKYEIAKTHLMGCLLLPIIIFFFPF